MFATNEATPRRGKPPRPRARLDNLDCAIASHSVELSSGEIDRLEEPYQPNALPPQLT